MKIIISNDHAGTVLKNGIIDYLNQNNHEVINIGTNNLDSVDYPDFGYNVAKSFKKEVIDFGILICGSGIGISIAANRYYNHIRAALCNDIETTKLSRLHNDANILNLSGRSTDKNLAIDCINTFNTKFEGGRHINRIKKLSNPPKNINGDFNMDGFFNNQLSITDPEISNAIENEKIRQKEQVELIASENIVSQAVLMLKEVF